MNYLKYIMNYLMKKHFDLKSVRACFKNNNIRQITTCSSFTRKLSFKGKKNVVYC